MSEIPIQLCKVDIFSEHTLFLSATAIRRLLTLQAKTSRKASEGSQTKGLPRFKKSFYFMIGVQCWVDPFWSQYEISNLVIDYFGGIYSKSRFQFHIIFHCTPAIEIINVEFIVQSFLKCTFLCFFKGTTKEQTFFGISNQWPCFDQIHLIGLYVKLINCLSFVNHKGCTQ